MHIGGRMYIKLPVINQDNNTPRLKLLFLVGFFLVSLFSCKDNLEFDKYKRPDWLAGKVYTQILEQPDLSTFAKCIKRVGYDSILDVSGSYTVFAPSNEAWKSYLSQKPEYDSIEDIPLQDLKQIVQYQIIQNAWSKVQLRTLDVYGWIDNLDLNNNKPRGFKRETLLREKNTKYGVAFYKPTGSLENKIIIVDTNNTSWYRKVIVDSRKYVPIFYQEYFDIYHLNSDDYAFYFNRPFDGPNDIYFAGAKIVSDEIFAENGFIYIVDRVVEPLPNAMEFISKDDQKKKYSKFKQLINIFPKFEYNEQKTFDQPGADQGILVDSLFNLSFPDLTFDLNAEKTSPPTGTYGLPENVTVRYHHGLMAPTNEAFDDLVNTYIKSPGGWGTLDAVPARIKKIIVNAYLSINPIYPSNFEKGFLNGDQDIIKLDPENILEQYYGSNCSFIGLKKAIVPRAFKSVTGPVYLLKGYSKVMHAIEKSGLLQTLKNPDKNYMFFVESDVNTNNDSSFFYHPVNDEFSLILRSYHSAKELYLSLNDLRTMLLNQIATRQPTGIPRKEFIPNLAGNYIIVNNETGEFSGTAPTTDGYHGDKVVPEYPAVLSDNVDNGITYDVENWFSFSGTTLYTQLATNYPKFHALLQKAGLSDDNYYRYNFISDNEYYTVFVPSDSALDSAGTDLMPINTLRNFLLLHFIQGKIILTDGSSKAGYYETLRESEKSTEYNKVYTKIYVLPGVDQITIPDKNGNEYVNIVEAEGKTNIFTVVKLNQNQGQAVFPVMFNNAVVHEIDKTLNINNLNTR